MRRRSAGMEDDAAITGVNVTPLVDVCLVLVIIFMVTAPMFSDPPIKVSLPKATTKEGHEADNVVVTLAQDGGMAVSDTLVKNIQEFSIAIRNRLAMSDDKYVIIRADAQATHGQLTQLMAESKKAGARSMTIATEQK